MILLAALFHNIQFFLFHLLAEVLPALILKRIYVKEMLLHADFAKLLILPFLVDISALSMFG